MRGNRLESSPLSRESLCRKANATNMSAMERIPPSRTNANPFHDFQNRRPLAASRVNETSSRPRTIELMAVSTTAMYVRNAQLGTAFSSDAANAPLTMVDIAVNRIADKPRDKRTKGLPIFGRARGARAVVDPPHSNWLIYVNLVERGTLGRGFLRLRG